jgi:hypothetical protein
MVMVSSDKGFHLRRIHNNNKRRSVRHEIRTDAIDSTAPFCARLTKEREREREPHISSGRDGTGVSAGVEVVLRRRVLGWVHGAVGGSGDLAPAPPFWACKPTTDRAPRKRLPSRVDKGTPLLLVHHCFHNSTAAVPLHCSRPTTAPHNNLGLPSTETYW